MNQGCTFENNSAILFGGNIGGRLSGADAGRRLLEDKSFDDFRSGDEING